ncbi:MAG: TIGR04133 family radical SAM/SPASM protein [Bacteroidales bacterium]|nr:TIGR04133 family radical SAM/SPASM protein [Bacteroides sp.]MCM1199371.1 TIGR04133 family radical SAM/SPASM protein [Clostridium sp.]MCM1501341.1 TIGR04133 family radical SAM/SPASM protein [Bacteroidales bacterium]
MDGLSIKKRIALELHRQIVKNQAVQHPLTQLFWECTLRCNLRCRHCGSDCKVSALHPDMPFVDFAKLLESVKEHYDSHKVMVMLTGGEPLMRSDIVRCGRAIYDMEFPWGLVSNGMLMTPRKIDELLSAGLHSATISLDGFEAEHDWMRGVKGSFARASEAVRILASEPSVNFDVVTCVNGKNIGYLPQLRDYLISVGLKNWRMFTVFPVGRAAADPELQLSAEQFRSLMEFIRQTRKEGRISARYGCEGFLGEFEGDVRDHLFYCAAGMNVASVLVDGSISACASIRSDYHQGNIYKDNFCDVWENRFTQYRDRSWMKTGKCAGCRYFRYCLGNGMHLRDEDGNLIMCHLDRL